MKNERGSDFFPSTKINGWKQKKKIANYVLPSAARALCSGRLCWESVLHQTLRVAPKQEISSPSFSHFAQE